MLGQKDSYRFLCIMIWRNQIKKFLTVRSCNWRTHVFRNRCCVSLGPWVMNKGISLQRMVLRRTWESAEQLLNQLTHFPLLYTFSSYHLLCSSSRRQIQLFRDGTHNGTFSSLLFEVRVRDPRSDKISSSYTTLGDPSYWLLYLPRVFFSSFKRCDVLVIKPKMICPIYVKFCTK